MTSPSLVSLDHVSKTFRSGLGPSGEVRAVDDVSMEMAASFPSIVTVAGESGSGKTTLALMVLGLLRPSAGRITVAGGPPGGNRRVLQAVFQNPFEAFNPFYRVEHALQVPIDKFGMASSASERRRMIDEVLAVVRLEPLETLGRFPHQLSGGQLQRLMIARALLLRPQLIVADEPVSMIDASLRAIVLDLMLRLRDDFRISILYITHDLSTALQISDQILVMFRGMVVERGAPASVIGSPRHPYTQALVASVPVPDPQLRWRERLPLFAEDQQTTSGCPYYGRCPLRMDRCRADRPRLVASSTGWDVACLLYEGSGDSADARPLEKDARCLR